MNLQAFMPAMRSINSALVIWALLIFPVMAHADWEVDWSHHKLPTKSEEPVVLPVKTLNENPQREEINAVAQEVIKPLESPLGVVAPEQELVLLNTDKGFLPQTLHVRQGGRYLIHVVNLNEKEKNVSFMLDAFSEHHATYYGKIKTFVITPQKDGIFTYQCPETSSQGRLVVAPAPTVDRLRQRMPASVGENSPVVPLYGK